MIRTACATIAAALVFAAPANANPDEVDYLIENLASTICTAIEKSPTPRTILGIANAIEKNTDLTTEERAEVIYFSVRNECPEQMKVIEQFAETYAPDDDVVIMR